MGPPTAVSDRLMHMSFNGPVKVTLVVAYAPTEAAHTRDKEAFYLQLTAILRAIPTSHCVFILRDLNAQVGNDREKWPQVVGRYGTFPKATSARPPRPLRAAYKPSEYPTPPAIDALFPVDRGSALDTTAASDLATSRFHAQAFLATIFNSPPAQDPQPTPRGRSRQARPQDPFPFLRPNDNGRRCLQLCIDLVLVSQRFRASVMDTRVLPYAISHNSDHRLVVCDIRLRLSSRCPSGGNLLAHVLSAPAPKDATVKTEAQAYYLREISQLLRNTTPTTPQPPEDVETEWTTFHSEFMRAAAQALPRPTQTPIQRHITTATVDLSIAKADALLVVKEARWKYQGSPRYPPDQTEDPRTRGSSQERGREAGPNAPALCTRSYPPALRRQRIDNRAGVEGYSKAEEHSTRKLCSQCADAEAGWPHSRLTATQGHISDMGIRPLPPVMEGSHSDVYLQGEEDKLLPDNYRGISLLSVCSKVYTNVLIDRLKPTIEPTLHEAQCGFRASRGCADQLFTMRRICELSKARRAPLFAAFVDYRKAFDSVNREAMWTLMAARGVDPHLVSLVKEMYNGYSGEVLIQGYRSRKFEMKTGVRQGCALSPLLYLQPAHGSPG
eukprot:gene6783-biopygen2694